MSDQDGVALLAKLDPDATKESDGTHVFGSNNAYKKFKKLFLSGALNKLSAPESGAIAAYLDAQGNVLHVGRVRNGPLLERKVIFHKIAGQPIGFLTYADKLHFEGIEGITDVVFVKDPFEPGE